MNLHIPHLKTASVSFLLFLHLSAIGGVPNRYAISLNGAKSTSLYKAPSHYSKERPLGSFIITSRPISFFNDPHKQEGNSLKSSLIQTNNKMSLTSVPGVATVVCKGISCGNSAMSFADWSTEDDGFAGEAIPLDDSEYMTAMVGQHQPQVVVTSAPKIKQGSTLSMVHLLTNRPYLRRGAPKQKIAAPTRKTYVERRSTTVTSTTTTRRRPIAAAQVATTTSKPAAAVSNAQPTIVFQRPSLMFPAMAAFSLMALPVAAAAVPFLLQGRRKRRSLHHSSMEDSTAFPEMDFTELISSLEDLENGRDRLDWAAGRRHISKVTKAKQRLHKFKSQSMSR